MRTASQQLLAVATATRENVRICRRLIIKKLRVILWCPAVSPAAPTRRSGLLGMCLLELGKFCDGQDLAQHLPVVIPNPNSSLFTVFLPQTISFHIVLGFGLIISECLSQCYSQIQMIQPSELQREYNFCAEWAFCLGWDCFCFKPKQWIQDCSRLLPFLIQGSIISHLPTNRKSVLK